MPRALLEIESASPELVAQLHRSNSPAGVRLTLETRPGRIERKTWPPTPEDIRILLEWSGEQTAVELAKWLASTLGGRARGVSIDRRAVPPGERSILEVLQEAREEGSGDA